MLLEAKVCADMIYCIAFHTANSTQACKQLLKHIVEPLSNAHQDRHRGQYNIHSSYIPVSYGS